MGVTTLTCPACSRPLNRLNFCEACGARAPRPGEPPSVRRLPSPRPMSEVSFPRQVHIQEILTPKTVRRNRHRSTRRRGVWVAGIGLVVVTGLGLGAFRLTGALGTDLTPAQQQASELERSQAELLPQLEVLMEARAAFFSGERRYLPAMKRVRAAIQTYNRRLAGVEREIDEISRANAARLRGCHNRCPDLDYPAYPRLPDLSPEVADLQRVATRMTQLHDQLLTVRGTAGIQMSYGELLSAVDLLGQDAKDNLVTLHEMRYPSRDGIYAGGAASLRIEALNGNNSLPVVRQMNTHLVRLLERSQLPVASYDLPGGRDKYPGDHSISQ
ncbi:hypothetical protein [Kineosporia sp. NBRC 101731]|uniref:hypothetical protein n=1 Tax=Kineosporia sp. NBRC 101731 TaxID=3032199 RepID=UPI00249FDF9E|nr:hypothetical protein [Kineosporia sp. NBRC 101731]GLY28196.1 hypothetical protein Kisp02_15610 [Kineosporia sp. NBRC 101731]